MGNLVCLFSSPRSGSTWLGKIFDSHPSVFYIHEPDIEDRGLDILPYWFAGVPDKNEVDAGRLYLKRLLTQRSMRAIGTRPFFKKEYRGRIAEWVRRGLILAAKGTEGSWLEPNSLPDFFTPRQGPHFTVMKAVSALGRVGRFVEAMPEMTPILILRHPCGYALSRMKGHRLGLMALPPSLEQLHNTQSARRIGVSMKTLTEGSVVQILAWEWLIANSEALAAIASRGGLVVSYEQLAQTPAESSRALFDLIGLSWHEQTRTFLAKAAAADGGYYSLSRAPRRFLDWQHELSAEDIAEIWSVVCREPIGRYLFADLPLPPTRATEWVADALPATP